MRYNQKKEIYCPCRKVECGLSQSVATFEILQGFNIFRT